MTFNSDIQKTEKEIAVLQKKLELLKEIETHKSQPRMNFELGGKFEIVSYDGENYLRLQFDDKSHSWYKRKYTVDGVLMVTITDAETERLLEKLWFNEVKGGKYEYDEVECDEKDNPKFMIMDEVVEWNEDANTPNLQKIMDRMVKKHQSQKLYNRVRDELGYSFDCCDEFVDLVEDWILDEQSSAGSQNVNTELLVEGFNDAIRKMKEMLR